MNEYFSYIVNITQRIDTYLDKQFTSEVLNSQCCCMDSEMEQKFYQALKDIEDMKGSKLLVFQVYLINLGRLSCPRFYPLSNIYNVRKIFVHFNQVYIYFYEVNYFVSQNS
jgi:hypothetical protein